MHSQQNTDNNQSSIVNAQPSTVNYYNIELKLIEAFFKSMELDLYKQQYDSKAYKEYIFGSAETVGLMCLYVFCEGDAKMYEQLKSHARSLGAAFQKVNFLRDIKNDFEALEYPLPTDPCTAFARRAVLQQDRQVQLCCRLQARFGSF